MVRFLNARNPLYSSRNSTFSGPLASFVGKNFDTRQGACWGQLRDEAVTLLPTCQQQALAPSTFLISIVISLSPMAPAASQDPSSKANLARTADSHRHTCHRRHTKKEVKVLRAGQFGGANPARPLAPQVRPRCGLGHQKGPRGVQSEP